MYIYIVFYFLIVLASVASVISPRFRANSMYIILVLLAGLLAAFRYKTGTDFENYQSVWRNINPFSLSIDFNYLRYEPGFVLVSSFLKSLYPGDFIFFAFYAIFSIYLVYLSSKKLEVNYWVFFLLFFCLFYFSYLMNAMRQMVSMGLFLYSLHYLYAGKTKNYIAVNFFGVFFHVSAIIYLVIYPLFKLKNLRVYVFASASFFVPVTIFLYLSGFGSFLFDFGVAFIGKSDNYALDFYEPASYFNLLMRLAALAGVIFIFLNVGNDRVVSFCTLSYIFGFCFYLMFSDYSLISSRIGMLFRIMELFLLGRYMVFSRILFNRVILFSIFLALYTSSFAVNILNSDYHYNFRVNY